MRIEWKSLDPSEGKKEFPVTECFFAIKKKDGSEIKYGRISHLERPDSLEDQYYYLLSQYEQKGIGKDQLDVVFITDNSISLEINKFLEGIKKTNTNIKHKKIPSLERVMISSSDGSIWIPKTVNQIKKVSSASKTKILIVEDSIPLQKILQKVYSDIPNTEIVGISESVEDAVEKVRKFAPDFISLDMNIKGGTGVDFLKRVSIKNERCVLVTDCSMSEGGLVLEALGLGASSYIQKPKLSDIHSFSSDLSDLLNGLFSTRQSLSQASSKLSKSSKNISKIDLDKIDLIAIGSSTGGTEIVRDLIAGFPKDCPPIVVVQHMPAQFTSLYADRISRQSGRQTSEVKAKMRLERGQAYIAAGGTHMKIEKTGGLFYVNSNDGELVNRFKPSVSVLFDSIHGCGLSGKTIAIMLTGMGRDGSSEMLNLRKSGAITIGQSQETCTVYGMPRAAEEIGALLYSGSPSDMIKALQKNISLIGA